MSLCNFFANIWFQMYSAHALVYIYNDFFIYYIFIDVFLVGVQKNGTKAGPVYSPYSFPTMERNPSLNIRTEKHLCDVDVTDLPGLPLTKAKVSLARPTQWPFNQATALLRTEEQCYFLSQNYKDRLLQET